MNLTSSDKTVLFAAGTWVRASATGARTADGADSKLGRVGWAT
ncbi:MAG: hypothetical protein NTV94_10920 [Planctomycetota bacterium]|nr:hypothetical protein [Planctomycetota bacterium]